LIGEYFPYFVREKLIRDLIVLNFNQERQPMPAYVEQGFRDVGFL
jgi:hypothetical protein